MTNKERFDTVYDLITQAAEHTNERLDPANQTDSLVLVDQASFDLWYDLTLLKRRLKQWHEDKDVRSFFKPKSKQHNW